MVLDQRQSARSFPGNDVNFLPPPDLNISLWRSLFRNVRDSIAPRRLPPLQLTSRPVQVGMLVGDILDLPWYRTILSNIGDAISPETLPPLQLESEPVDVELVSDQPAWWRSLLRNLADAVAPERQIAVRLTSSPADPNMASQVLITPRWSSLIESPLIADPLLARRKVFASELWNKSSDGPIPAAAPMRTILLQLPLLDAQPAPEFEDFERKLVRQLQRSIRRSRVREFVWLSVIVIEVTTLVLLRVLPH